MMIRKLCFGIVDSQNKLKLHSLLPHTVYNLSDFVKAQQEQAETVATALESFQGAALSSVEVAW